MRQPHGTRRRGPSLSVMILVIAAVSVGFGFLFNFVCTLVERQLYPVPYGRYVEAYATEYDIPPNLLYAVIKSESDFDSGAVSEDGAVGLMQLMPDTFRWLSDEILHEYLPDGLRYDPETNVRYGACLLSRLYRVYGNWDTTLAAYNAGSGHVDGWLQDKRYSPDGIHLTAIPFDETREYVKRVTNARSMYDSLYPNGALAPSEATETHREAVTTTP